MDSRPGYGWRNRECRPCRSAPHKVEWRSGKGKRDAFYFLSSKDFLRRCGGYSFSKPYCWWMEFDFLMLCWICFTFIAVSFYLCGRRWVSPVLLVIFIRVVFSFAISPFYPHLAFFSFFFLAIASTTQRIPFLLFALLQQSKQVTPRPWLLPRSVLVYFIYFVTCVAST